MFNMPAGILTPARNMPSMIGRNGNNVGGFVSTSGLVLSQVCIFFIFYFCV